MITEQFVPTTPPDEAKSGSDHTLYAPELSQNPAAASKCRNESFSKRSSGQDRHISEKVQHHTSHELQGFVFLIRATHAQQQKAPANYRSVSNSAGRNDVYRAEQRFTVYRHCGL